MIRGRLGNRTVAAVKLLLEDLLGVFLGLLGGVGVGDVGLVAAGDLGFGHGDGVGYRRVACFWLVCGTEECWMFEILVGAGLREKNAEKVGLPLVYIRTSVY